LTALITGASGLIGSHLCKQMAYKGYPVVGLVFRNRPQLSMLPAAEPVEIISCDIRDSRYTADIIERYKIKTVFHFAAHLPSTATPEFIKVNVIGTSDLLDACYRGGVKNFIYASSMSVYSAPPTYLPVNEVHPTRPEDTYGRTKLIGELLCECYSRVMKTTTIRFSSVFGPGDNARVAHYFMQSAISGQPIQVDGDGSQSSDFIYVDDAIQGAMLAMEKGKSGEVYNIGSGQETSVLELANLITGLANPPVEVLLSGKPATRPFRFVADISKARKELGYNPNGLVDGLRKYREEMKKNELH